MFKESLSKQILLQYYKLRDKIKIKINIKSIKNKYNISLKKINII